MQKIFIGARAWHTHEIVVCLRVLSGKIFSTCNTWPIYTIYMLYHGYHGISITDATLEVFAKVMGNVKQFQIFWRM